MKIFLIGQKGIPAKNGGVEKHVEELAIRLANQGHDVFAYARKNYNTEKLKEHQGVHIITLPSLGTKHLDAISHTFLASLDLIFRRKADLVHFHSIGPSFLLFLVKIGKPRTPVIFTFHCQDYYHQKWGRLARLALKTGEKFACLFADRIISVSQELKEYIEQKYRKHPIYIPNGTTIHDKNCDQNILNQYGLEPKKYIFTASRLIRHKGLHHLIMAFRALPELDYHLVIAGEGFFTDDYVAELKTLANGDKRIIFTGNQTGDNLQALYENAALFVQPSESEGLSIALLEAMSFALPCLASDIPANREALLNTGFFFESKNIEDLRLQILKIFNDYEGAIKKGEEARKRIEAEYEWDKVASQVAAVYSSCQ